MGVNYTMRCIFCAASFDYAAEKSAAPLRMLMPDFDDKVGLLF